MPDLKAFYQPRTLSEAIALLEAHGDRARPLAGGTSLAVSKSPRVDVLVDLGRVGIDRVEDEPDGVHVGSMTTCTALRRHLAGRPPGALRDALERIASRILQNQITVGGNCVMVFSWSDLPVALWCAGAQAPRMGPMPEGPCEPLLQEGNLCNRNGPADSWRARQDSNL